MNIKNIISILDSKKNKKDIQLMTWYLLYNTLEVLPVVCVVICFTKKKGRKIGMY